MKLSIISTIKKNRRNSPRFLSIFQKLLFFIFILVIPFIPSFSTEFSAGLYAEDQTLQDKAEKTISALLNPDVKFTRNLYKIPEQLKKNLEKEVKQNFYRDTVTLWEITRDNRIIAYAMMDDVLGKMMPITFLVLFEPNGAITDCKVIKYRERYGKGIKNKRWLKQFRKKNVGSGFIVEKDIDGISGATISVGSITKGIEKLTHLMTYLLKEKKVDISLKNN